MGSHISKQALYGPLGDTSRDTGKANGYLVRSIPERMNHCPLQGEKDLTASTCQQMSGWTLRSDSTLRVHLWSLPLTCQLFRSDSNWTSFGQSKPMKSLLPCYCSSSTHGPSVQAEGWPRAEADRHLRDDSSCLPGCWVSPVLGAASQHKGLLALCPLSKVQSHASSPDFHFCSF